jgi:hypothetical protein
MDSVLCYFCSVFVWSVTGPELGDILRMNAGITARRAVAILLLPGE